MIHRRELLKGCGLTAAAALTASKMSATGQDTLITPNRLNVVIHGLIAVVVDRPNNRLRLLLPDVPGHSYGMGKFGSEFLLEQHGYSLTVPGAEGAIFPDPDPNLNPVIDLQSSVRPLPDKARHVIDLPLPNYRGVDTPSLLRMRVSRRVPIGGFFGPKGPRPAEVPVLHGFSYTFDPANPPLLSGGGWKIADSMNLHIWANPAFLGNATHVHHSLMAFQGLFDAPLPGTIDRLFSDPLARAVDIGGVPANEQYAIYEQRATLSKTAEPGGCGDFIVIHPPNP